MICPVCNHKNHLELDMHSDGYADDLVECIDCGALFRVKGESVLETVHGPTDKIYETV